MEGRRQENRSFFLVQPLSAPSLFHSSHCLRIPCHLADGWAFPVGEVGERGGPVQLGIGGTCGVGVASNSVSAHQWGVGVGAAWRYG